MPLKVVLDGGGTTNEGPFNREREIRVKGADGFKGKAIESNP